MTSIRYTLIKRITLIIVITFISVISSITYLKLQTSSENLSITKKYVLNALIDNGLTLVTNNSRALQGMAEDNAFSAVQNLVSDTVLNNKNIIYGIYMDEENRAWAMSSKNNPRGKLNENVILKDEIAKWAAGLRNADYRYLITDEMEGYEFAAPVIVESEFLGVIRYAFSTEDLNLKLKKVASLAETDLYRTLYIISFLSLGALVFSFLATKYIATKVTYPLAILSEATKRIIDGDYETSINIKSDNEIGLLSNNFESMRIQIKQSLQELIEHQDQLKVNNDELQVTQSELKNLNLNLEKKVVERTKELKSAQNQLLEAAHSAGMAEVAINVLHNLGNVLNSVKISNQHSQELLRKSKIKVLKKTNDLLKNHSENLADYLTKDEKGKKVPGFYVLLGDQLIHENDELNKDFIRISQGVETMHRIISDQQTIAMHGEFKNDINVVEVINESINIQMSVLLQDNIVLTRDFKDVGLFLGDSTKLHQIVTNLISNSTQAVVSNEINNRKINVSIYPVGEEIFIKVNDNGIGIDEKVMEKIFSHGFTTNKDGHGFGLHSCANYLTEMKGRIYVESDGIGCGASFYVVLPVSKK